MVSVYTKYTRSSHSSVHDRIIPSSPSIICFVVQVCLLVLVLMRRDSGVIGHVVRTSRVMVTISTITEIAGDVTGITTKNVLRGAIAVTALIIILQYFEAVYAQEF